MKSDIVEEIDTRQDHDHLHEISKPPAVEGEEDPASGSATSSEPLDIDKALRDVGLHGDEKGVKPLDISGELKDEEL